MSLLQRVALVATYWIWHTLGGMREEVEWGTYGRLWKELNLPTIGKTDNLVSPTNAQQSRFWMLRHDLFDEIHHPLLPSRRIRALDNSSADDDEVILVSQVRITSFSGLEEINIGAWRRGLDACDVALVGDVEAFMRVEDAGDANGELDHGGGGGSDGVVE